jgi:Fe-S-cluster containining protein
MRKRAPNALLKEFQQHINKTIYDFSDCSICALCCKDEVLTITEKDAYRISRKLGIDKKAFYDQYTHYNPDTFETVMNMPCAFLKNNRCTIYPIRPNVCSNYPVFVLKDGIVAINEIEACAKATHFHELLLDYCQEYHPDFYKTIKHYGDGAVNEKTIKNAYYSINIIALFVEWLHKHQKQP